jgi:hypothetical protein
MRFKSRLLNHIRSNLIAYVALFFAMSGTAAFASNLTTRAPAAPNALCATPCVYSSDIVNGQVFGVDVASNSLTGSDIAESTLSVAGMGCQTGKVLGFARVKGSASVPAFYTSSSAYIDVVNNCAGGAVQIRRVSTGVYHVRFINNPAALAVATPNADGYGLNSIYNDNIITVAKGFTADEGSYFRVEVEDSCGDCSGGTDPQDGHFMMLLP